MNKDEAFAAIDGTIADIQHVLQAGTGINDYPDYKFITGQISGLKRAKQVLDEVFKKRELDDD